MIGTRPHVGSQVAVKICGINDAAALDAAAEAGADWVGFVFFARSPRAVTLEAASALAARAAGGPGRVGLFVDPTDETLAETLRAVPLDALQLYAPPTRTREIAARFGLPVWRAVGVAARGDLPGADSEDGAARWLVESRPPPDATRPGGNAHAIDWTLTAGWAAPRPWLLAGGLTQDRIAAAIRTSGATAVDLSSGVESAPGVKSPALIRAFVTAAMASPTIGRADADEAEAVARAHVEAWRETYRGLLPPSVFESKTVEGMRVLWARSMLAGDAIFVARDPRGIVGLASAGSRTGESVGYDASLRAIYVLRRGQLQGLGRALMGAVAGDLVARSLRSCTLQVLDGNAPALRFYDALGGTVLGRHVDADGVAHLTYGWRDVTQWLAGPPAADSAG